MSEGPPAQAGWYADPEDPGLMRYWTGLKWTEDRVPAIAAPNFNQPTQTIIRLAKSTTVGVLLWLFLGSLGAHRHYVRKHLTGVAQLGFYVIAGFLAYVGAQAQTSDYSDGSNPGMGLQWSGAILAIVTAIWVFLDVFFIAGWVRVLNEVDSLPASVQRDQDPDFQKMVAEEMATLESEDQDPEYRRMVADELAILKAQDRQIKRDKQRRTK